MDKKDMPGFSGTHSQLESLSILNKETTEKEIQAFIDKDYSWATAEPSRHSKVTDGEVDALIENIETMITEPDWTPNC